MSLFVDDMILHIENHKDSTQNKYRMNKSWDVLYGMVNISNCVAYLKVARRVALESSHHKKKNFYLCRVMAVN